MIRNLIFEFYPLSSDFQVESLKAIKSYQKKHSFYKTVSLKKPHLFYNLNSLNILRKTHSRNTAKNLIHFTSFSAKILLVGARKNIRSVPFLYTQELHL